MFAVKIRKNKIIGAFVLLVLLIASTWLIAHERGPLECDNGCEIGYPMPDEATVAYIEQMKPLFQQWFGDMFWHSGDIYIICNATHCAKYKITYDFGLYGEGGRITREPAPGGVGGGGGGGGSSHTPNPGEGYRAVTPCVAVGDGTYNCEGVIYIPVT